MPNHEYTCQNEDCGETVEAISTYCTEDLTQCLKCGQESLVRTFSQTSPPVFKGSGFHANDYGGKKPR